MFVIKIDGYDPWIDGAEDFASYCYLVNCETLEDANDWLKNNERASNENRNVFQVENFEDAVDYLVNDNGVQAENIHEIFMELANEFAWNITEE